jgi:hypothetical protein
MVDFYFGDSSRWSTGLSKPTDMFSLGSY